MNHAFTAEAYLDIETTGLSFFNDTITVIGIYRHTSNSTEFIQLVDTEITWANLGNALAGVDKIYTYNGSRFDIPFINFILEIDIADNFRHHDLMYDCWRRNLYGGLKAVERQLGISRQLKDIDGRQAITLWWNYRLGNDHKSLSLLLQYNKEDVLNLQELRNKLFCPAQQTTNR